MTLAMSEGSAQRPSGMRAVTFGPRPVVQAPIAMRVMTQPGATAFTRILPTPRHHRAGQAHDATLEEAQAISASRTAHIEAMFTIERAARSFSRRAGGAETCGQVDVEDQLEIIEAPFLLLAKDAAADEPVDPVGASTAP